LVERRAGRALVGELVGEVADRWTDVWGRTHTIGPATRAALEQSLGPKRPARAAAVPAGGGRCHQPEALRNGRRVWGLAVQLYGIRSARNWGIGDFGDLRALVELAASLGASLVGVNPLHAGGPSPYSPSSRHALNTLYLDVEALPEYARSAAARRLVASRAFQRELARLRAAPLVEHAGVAACKRRVLQLLFDTVVDRARVRRFGRACARGVRDYAVFEALRERLGDGWQGWPEAYRDPRSRGVAAFARRWRDRVDFHLWVQSHARDQLDGVQRHAAALGMPIGLYVDLALGGHPRGGGGGWEN
jgi:(1->4)-alpha-D-glucan 1-alpha-D-glucosylmutase